MQRVRSNLHFIDKLLKINTFLFGTKIFTARKRSLGQGNIFSSVCQEFCTRGGLPQCILGYHPPPPQTRQNYQAPRWSRHPLDQAPPEQALPPPWSRHAPRPGTPPPEQTPPEQTPPRAGTPSEQTPPTLLRSACWEIRSTSGWYASYWNAMLLEFLFMQYMEQVRRIKFTS